MTTIPQLAADYAGIAARHAELAARIDDLDAAEAEELSGLEADVNRFAEATQRRRILNLCGAGYTIGDRLRHPDLTGEAVVGLGDTVTVSIDGTMHALPLMEATHRLKSGIGRGPALGDWNRDGHRLGAIECWDARSPTWTRGPRVPLPRDARKTPDGSGAEQLGLF